MWCTVHTVYLHHVVATVFAIIACSHKFVKSYDPSYQIGLNPASQMLLIYSREIVMRWASGECFYVEKVLTPPPQYL